MLYVAIGVSEKTKPAKTLTLSWVRNLCERKAKRETKEIIFFHLFFYLFINLLKVEKDVEKQHVVEDIGKSQGHHDVVKWP